MGGKVFHVGTGEEARFLKLVMNMMVGLTSAMVAEALTFGEAGGMNWEQMIDIVNASVAASPLFGYKAAMLKSRNFGPALPLGRWRRFRHHAGHRKVRTCLPITSWSDSSEGHVAKKWWTSFFSGHLLEDSRMKK
jgi:hypothetical protein